MIGWGNEVEVQDQGEFETPFSSAIDAVSKSFATQTKKMPGRDISAVTTDDVIYLSPTTYHNI